MHDPGHVIFIAGLPGSGKTSWMKESLAASEYFAVDDFMANALDNVFRFTYSRWYVSLVFALRAGRNAAISDIAFCDEEWRRQAERVMVDAVRGLEHRWIFFENEPEACRLNIMRDALAGKRSSERRLEALDSWSRRYKIPSGAEVVPVFRGVDVAPAS